MALEATHTRFALEIKEDLKARDLPKYLSGVIYPDSRYVTGIDREATHNKKYSAKNFAKDDFHKGWHAHVLYDIIQGEVIDRLFPQMAYYKSNDFVTWQIERNAIITVQDKLDLEAYPFKDHLRSITYYHNPNDEDLRLVKEYYDIVKAIYLNREMNFDDYREIWLRIGGDRDITPIFSKKAEEYFQAEETRNKIKKIFPQSLKLYKDSYKKKTKK